MQVSGYSGKPLYQKLGIKPGIRLRTVQAPDDYLALLGMDISSQVVKSGGADWIHLFAKNRQELENHLPALIAASLPGGCIWISWYKQSAKIPTDLNENLIREIVLPLGWVDIKVCAVSEIWSGLKIVRRKK
jgi:hypothetical protein